VEHPFESFKQAGVGKTAKKADFNQSINLFESGENQ